MASHLLKTDPDPFQAVWDKKKKFEIRFNDRRFQVGDYLVLRETSVSGTNIKRGVPWSYTSRVLQVQVTYILSGYGLVDGWVILSISDGFVVNEKMWQETYASQEQTIEK